jgi:hypothetical protein
MVSQLRFLLTLFTILCFTTIASASVQKAHAGFVFEKTWIFKGVSHFPVKFLAANRVGYHATHADVVPLIQQNGFRAGTAPGRLGSGGTYVNSTPQGAIAEFAHHNPGVTPSVLKVQYHPGINASTSVAPRNYVERLPFHNVDSISAPSVRLPGTTNTNVLNGSLRIIE